jgi:outer membrane protein insertion porin family
LVVLTLIYGLSADFSLADNAAVTNAPLSLYLSGISFSGADSLKEKKMLKALNLETGSVVDPDVVNEALGRLMLEYQDEFFYDARAGWKLNPTEKTDWAELSLNIQEGPHGKIRSVRIEGNVVLDDEALLKQLKMSPAKKLSNLTGSGIFRRQELSADQKTIEDHYRNRGYLAVAVEPEVTIPMPETIHVKWVVVEGELYTFREILVEGAKVLDLGKLEQTIRLKPGGIAAESKIMNAGRRLKNAYLNRGYADVNVGVERVLVPGEKAVNLKYTVDEGGIVHLGNLVITGNEQTKDKVIRRELVTKTGDAYVESLLIKNKQRLDNLGFFEPVTVKTSDTIDGKRDVYIEAKDRPTGRAQVGAYYSTVEDLVGTLELSQQNFDLFGFPGLKGAGQKARILLRAGSSRRDAEFYFTEPWFLDRRLSMGVGLFYRDHGFVSDDYDQLSMGGTTSLGIPLNQFDRLRFSYTLQDISIYNVSDDASDSIKNEAGDFLKSEAGVRYVHDSRDRYFRSSRGNRTTLGATYSGGILQGTVDNYGLSGQTSYYFPVFKRNVLNIRGWSQTVDPFGDSDDVPIFDRVFLGGPHTLRGFQYREASPKDSEGSPIGGNTGYMFNIEHYLRTTNWLDISVYYDAGVVNADSYDFGSEDYYSNWGVGFTFAIPNFPLRFDYAIPLETDEYTDRDYLFSFSGGVYF